MNEKINKIDIIKNKDLPKEYISDIWGNLKYNNINNNSQVEKILSRSWLTGFIEAEGSFLFGN